jgi:peptide/nickel transport system substrate-binding protein
VSLAVDREAMAKLVYGGRASALTTHVTPANRLWRDPTLKPIARAPREARKLLESAGYRLGGDRVLRDPRGRPVEFTILVNAANEERGRMAAMIVQDLKELGIQVQVANVEFRTLLDRVLRSKNYEACLFGFASGDVDPGSEMSVWPSDAPQHVWAPGQAAPGADWEAEIDRLMRQQMATQGYAARRRLYDRVQQVEAREVPIVVLVSPDVLVAAKTRVGNFRPAVLDHYTLWNAEELYLRPAPGEGRRR